MMWLFSFLFLLPVVVSDTCPNYRLISPCMCKEISLNWKWAASFICGGLQTPETIGKIADAMRGVDAKSTFSIVSSVLNFLPADAFQGMQVEELEIGQSTLQSLTDTDVAFVGLEDYLVQLSLTQVNLMSDWDWSVLKNLKKLQKIYISKGNVKLIDDGVLQMSAETLEKINFEIGEIEYLGDNAFAQFTNLKSLVISSQRIRNVKRSMIANPAQHLEKIVFSFNPLEHLPADFFTNMPKLLYLHLDYTDMLTLDEKVFKPVWSNLYIFQFGNKLICDCRLAWILKQEFPVNFHAECESPKNLYLRKVETLKPHELVCFL